VSQRNRPRRHPPPGPSRRHLITSRRRFPYAYAGYGCRVQGLTPGTPIAEIPSTSSYRRVPPNGRIEDLRAADRVFEGGRCSRVSALVVPGCETVRYQAEAEGLDKDLHRGGDRGAAVGLPHVPGHDPHTHTPTSSSLPARRQHEQPHLEGRKQAPAVRTHLVSRAMAPPARDGPLVDVAPTARPDPGSLDPRWNRS